MRLIQFPDSPIAGAYTVDRDYQTWLLPEWAAFWRLVLVRAFLQVGAAAIPPRIFDCATEDGGTPDGHPGHAHDGGYNLDRGYAMTGNPQGDYIVGPSRNAQLTGDPTLLDTMREGTILAIAAELDGEFNGLVMNVAVDPILGGDPNRRPGVLERTIEGLPFSAAVRQRAEAMINSSADSSWDRYHHHHSHTRHYGRRDGDALEREFNSRVERLVTPSPPAIPLDGESWRRDVERRLTALEAR